MIDELTASSADLAKLLHETVSTLTELLADRPSATGADGGLPLAPDVLEIARLQAQAAGVSVEDYVQAAVLAFAAHTDGDGDGDRSYRRGVREESRRLRAENQALKAEGARAAARATQLDARSKASRQPAVGSAAKPTDDG
jgi:hypothetical protein